MNKFLLVAFILSIQSISSSCMQQEQMTSITQTNQRCWRSASCPDLSDPTFANRFGYEIITVTNRPFRPRAVSDTALSSVSDDLMLHQGYSYKETLIDHVNKTLEGTTSSSESSDWTPPHHNVPQSETPKASSKHDRYKAIAMSKCIIN